ncbi:hypothetical protein Goklo_024190 [Gossypium klotzschianum]|uniref:Retrotransposon gag domain-containing protein n=1 Tax=Gossypium klotzschianum TaxID=34286 RepID=A0A7J8W4H0_9ROSI|nr:hypothetical protein [Gossypium klotzschianum]
MGTKSTYDMDNFLWKMENYFRTKGIVDDTVKEEARAKVARDNATGQSGGYVREFKELMLQVSEVAKKEVLLTFRNGLKSWVKQEVEQRGVQKLLEAMTDHKEDIDGNSNSDNSSNGKPQVGKKKPNRKIDNLKYFFWDGLHILKKCLKKFALSKKEKTVGKALGLG